MISYVIGEENNGLSLGRYGLPITQKNREQAKKNIRESQGKRVMCVIDNKEFETIGDAGRYYGLRTSFISRSVKQNKAIYNRSQNKMFQFVSI